MPAVMPVSEQLEALVTGPAYEEMAAQEAARLDLRVQPLAAAPGGRG
jgi:hypothetical protein